MHGQDHGTTLIGLGCRDVNRHVTIIAPVFVPQTLKNPIARNAAAQVRAINTEAQGFWLLDHVVEHQVQQAGGYSIFIMLDQHHGSQSGHDMLDLTLLTADIYPTQT